MLEGIPDIAGRARSGFRPGTRPLTIDSESGSMLPAVFRAGPLRIVGAEAAPSTTVVAGKKLVLIIVPSKDSTMAVNATGLRVAPS